MAETLIDTKPSQIDRAELREKLRQIKKANANKSLFYFGKEILGFDKFDEEVHGEWEVFLEGGKRLKLVLIPRDHFKSTFFTISYPLQQLCLDKTKRFLLANAVYGNAQSFLKSIKRQVEQNPKLRWWELKPGDNWSDEELTVQRQSIHKEPSISIAGVGSQLPSQHYDCIVWDDLVNDKNITTKEQADKVISFWKDTINLLEPGGLGIVVGTRWSHRDLYKYIEDNLSRDFDIIIRKAKDSNGKIYFENLFSQAELDRRRRLLGPYKYSLNYMNELIDPEDAVFKRAWIQKYSKLPDPVRIFQTIDPALSEDPSADYSVIMTCAVDHEGNIYIVDYFRGRVNPRKLIDQIFVEYEKYRPVSVGIETVAFQKTLRFWLEDRMNEESVFLPLEELKTSNKTKPDRILALQPYFSNRKVYIKRHMADLEDELVSFRYPENNMLHDDLVDALAYQLELVYKPDIVKTRKLTYMSPEWFEDRYSGKTEESDLANPHMYR